MPHPTDLSVAEIGRRAEAASRGTREWTANRQRWAAEADLLAGAVEGCLEGMGVEGMWSTIPVAEWPEIPGYAGQYLVYSALAGRRRLFVDTQTAVPVERRIAHDPRPWDALLPEEKVRALAAIPGLLFNLQTFLAPELGSPMHDEHGGDRPEATMREFLQAMTVAGQRLEATSPKKPTEPPPLPR